MALALAGSAASAAPAATPVAGKIVLGADETDCYLFPQKRGGALLSASDLADALGGRLIEPKRYPGRYDLVIPARGKPKHIVRFQRGKSALMVDWVKHFAHDGPRVIGENVYVSVDFAKTLVRRLLHVRSRYSPSRHVFSVALPGTKYSSAAPRREVAHRAPPAAVVPVSYANSGGLLHPLSQWWRDRIGRSHGGASKSGGKLSVVVIDAGHGGYDSGANGPTGLHEKDATLAIALRLRDLITRQMPEVKVVLTRSDDRYVSLGERARIANAAQADLFLSIHMNSSPSRHANGTEVYRYSATSNGTELEKFENQGAPEDSSGAGLDRVLAGLEESTKDRFSVELGGLVKQSLVQSTGYDLNDRHDDIEGARFFVLAHAKMPAVLVEVAFISNRREEKLLRTAEFQQDVADALCGAIAKYRGSVEGKSPVVARGNTSGDAIAAEAPVATPAAPEAVSGAAEAMAEIAP